MFIARYQIVCSLCEDPPDKDYTEFYDTFGEAVRAAVRAGFTERTVVATGVTDHFCSICSTYIIGV